MVAGAERVIGFRLKLLADEDAKGTAKSFTDAIIKEQGRVTAGAKQGASDRIGITANEQASRSRIEGAGLAERARAGQSFLELTEHTHKSVHELEHGFIGLGRAIALFGVSVAEDKRRALEMWASVESGGQAIESVIKLVEGGQRAWHVYKDAVEAAAAAQKALSIGGRLAGAASVSGAGAEAGAAALGLSGIGAAATAVAALAIPIAVVAGGLYALGRATGDLEDKTIAQAKAARQELAARLAKVDQQKRDRETTIANAYNSELPKAQARYARPAELASVNQQLSEVQARAGKSGDQADLAAARRRVADAEAERDQAIQQGRHSAGGYNVLRANSQQAKEIADAHRELQADFKEREQKVAEIRKRYLEEATRARAQDDASNADAYSRQKAAEQIIINGKKEELTIQQRIRETALRSLADQIQKAGTLRDLAKQAADAARGKYESGLERFGMLDQFSQQRVIQLKKTLDAGKPLNPDDEEFIAANGDEAMQKQVRQSRIERGARAVKGTGVFGGEGREASGKAGQLSDRERQLADLAAQANKQTGAAPTVGKIEVEPIVHRIELQIQADRNKMSEDIVRLVKPLLDELKSQLDREQFTRQQDRAKSMR